MKKKILSLLLALALCLSLLPASAAAAANRNFIIENGVLVKYTGAAGPVTIPDGVTAIGERAFYSLNPTSVTMPDSVTSIGKEAFALCWSLDEIKLSPNITSIGEGAFRECSICSGGLTSISLPEKLTSIGDYAFEGCDTLTGMTLPNSLKSVGVGLFQKCAGLTTVTLPGNLTAIPESMFRGCTNLTHVDIPQTVTSIGDYAFSICPSLGNVTIPGDVRYIGRAAFNGCESMTTIAFPEGVTSVGDWMFGDCTSLTSVKLPSTIQTIGEFAFDSCPSLTEINLPEGLTSIGPNAFEHCCDLDGIKLPGTLKSIGREAFIYCTGLTSLELPASLEEIGVMAFGCCSGLRSGSVRFPEPSSLRSIGTMAFDPWIMGDIPDAVKLAVYEYAQKQWANPAESWAEVVSVGGAGEEVLARIDALAEEITAGKTGDYEKTKAISDWVSENISYDFDYYNKKKESTNIRLEDILNNRLTVCDGYASLTLALLRASGIPVLKIFGSSSGFNGWDAHAWNEAYVDGRWVVMDATWGAYYFDMDLERFSHAHIVSGRAARAEDVPTDWAQTLVWNAICGGLVPDELQGAYRTNITRAQFAAIAVNLYYAMGGGKVDAVGLENPFSDTEDPRVVIAEHLKIVNGVGESKFDPEGTLTREQAATMLARVYTGLGGELPAVTATAFADDGEFSSWSRNAVSFMSEKKIVSGVGENKFGPQNSITIQESIMIAQRMLENLSK